ncbi:MAG: hypothetical protein R3E77_12015 [Steroidobacteraceae bacterium]
MVGSRQIAAWLAAAALVSLPQIAPAAKSDPEKLPVTRVRDLHYGDVLFQFYQGNNFEALTRLNAYEQWQLLPNHKAEAQLLRGGLYLELGLHNEAGQIFQALLTPDIPQGVRNRAWFYLGKVWYARGYYDRAEQAIRQVAGTLSPQLEAEKQHLLANVLMRQEKYDEAIALLNGWRGPADWVAFAQFNLGVALVRKGLLADAARFLGAVGSLETSRRELLALRDRANLALGFAYLQAQQPAEARNYLLRVRLNGPYSNKALLGAGWADAQLGDYRAALTPWLELHDRNLLDAAVQESFLAVPYAFGKLNANAQAAEYYESAVSSFADESSRIDSAVQRIRSGEMLDAILQREADGANFGWFWQLKELPNAVESRYLYTILAGHGFQEGLKNYRDLVYLGGTLGRWQDNLVAYQDMIDTRDRAYAERLPRADALLASDKLQDLRQYRGQLEAQLKEIERGKDVAALGTAEERDQWRRIRAVEVALESAPAEQVDAETREKLRLVKGVLYYRLDEAFRGRMWQERRAFRELDLALFEAQNRWVRVQRARTNSVTNTAEFAARLDSVDKRLRSLLERLQASRTALSNHLSLLATNELGAQQQRLATYQVQARFALASIYDRAANNDLPTEPAQPSGPTSDGNVPEEPQP